MAGLPRPSGEGLAMTEGEWLWRSGRWLATTKRNVTPRLIFTNFDTGANGILSGVIGSPWVDFCAGYFRLLMAFRIMPVKMLNMPAIMNRVVSTVLPMANWPVVVAI